MSCQSTLVIRREDIEFEINYRELVGMRIYHTTRDVRSDLPCYLTVIYSQITALIKFTTIFTIF